jgi:hypothetical protein
MTLITPEEARSSCIPILIQDHETEESFVNKYFHENTEETRANFSCENVKTLAQALLENNEGERPRARRRMMFEHSQAINETAVVLSQANQSVVQPNIRGNLPNLALIGVFNKLVKITFSELHLPDANFPKSIRLMVNLENLAIIDSGLADVSFLPSLPALQHLDLQHNEITQIKQDELPAYKLRSLNLRDNPISKEDAEELVSSARVFTSTLGKFVNGENIYRVPAPAPEGIR